ncbi:MAG TPA: hypothetical protein DDZ88_27885 [Verrucomicrobiales bacterium]|nr:hypothetical protein [Verrucomicrobiales bacterium]
MFMVWPDRVAVIVIPGAMTVSWLSTRGAVHEHASSVSKAATVWQQRWMCFLEIMRGLEPPQVLATICFWHIHLACLLFPPHRRDSAPFFRPTHVF